MTSRNDIHGTHRPPKAIEEYLVRLAGKNPFGEPLLRLVVASERYFKVGGPNTQHQVWRNGSQLCDRGGLVDGEGTEFSHGLQASSDKPISVVVGVREALRYPGIEGWVLEKWFPAHMWGSPDHWERNPLLGPFPETGEYDMIAGPSAEPPEKMALQMAYAQYCDRIENTEGTLEARVRARVNAAIEKERREDEELKKEHVAKMRDLTRPIWSSSLAGGRLRTKLGERLERRGVKLGHIGN